MMSGGDSDKICKDRASKSSNVGVCDVNDKLKNMSTADKEDVSICANCGKEGSSDDMNTCNKCKMVKYCNAVCKKVHKKKHKKECEEHVRRAAEKHDEDLFKEPPSHHEDCPICYVRLPTLNSGWQYQSCCGKVICSGCVYAPRYDNQGNEVDNRKCAFCRTTFPKTDEDVVESLKKRVEAGDPLAIHNLGVYYWQGIYSLPQDHTKALEHWYRAAELGYATSYLNIGVAYVEVDKKEARHYHELAAIGGEVIARHKLGKNEAIIGNFERAVKHYLIAVQNGCDDSLKMIKELYSKGYATKEDYTTALKSYQIYLGEVKSAQRDIAAADNEGNRYY